MIVAGEDNPGDGENVNQWGRPAALGAHAVPDVHGQTAHLPARKGFRHGRTLGGNTWRAAALNMGAVFGDECSGA
jgi:hypothetical protein